MLILPRRFTQQPNIPAAVDPKYRPASGLQPRCGFVDSSGFPFTVAQGAAVVGDHINFGSATSDRLERSGVFPDYPASFVAVAKVAATPGAFNSYLGTISNSGTSFYSAVSLDSAYILEATTNGTGLGIASVNGWRSAEINVVVAVFHSPSLRKIYLKNSGGYYGSEIDTNTVLAFNPNRCTFGNRFAGQSGFNGDIYMAEWLGVTLGDAEVWNILDNPWGIYTAPRRMYVPLPPPGPIGSLGQFDPELCLSAWF
jgi:hypothetical protein